MEFKKKTCFLEEPGLKRRLNTIGNHIGATEAAP